MRSNAWTTTLLVLAATAAARGVAAQPAPPATVSDPPASQDAPPADTSLQIHGFASEGGFVSTANDYIGDSSTGSLQFFEAALNVSKQIDDRLRVGIQIYGRDIGTFKDLPPRIDWAYFDYRWKPWLGIRGGIIKMPIGLYNEFADIDSSRLSILLPQSVYPLRDRTALLAQTGFSIYGDVPLGGGSAGELEYQAWLGTLDIPSDALSLEGATLDNADTKYVTGAQVFWQTPLEGLRVGGTYMRTTIDFKLTLDPASVTALEMAGLLPAGFNGNLDIYTRPDQLLIGSAEYALDDWLFAAEYARWLAHEDSSLSMLVPVTNSDSERFYGLAAYRFSPALEAGGYYSVVFADANNRSGSNTAEFKQPFDAWQRDAAATLRWDVNDHWLWKVEAHFIDGAADLDLVVNPNPTRYWGLFLLKTTVTF